MNTQIGKIISHYRVIEKIGEGGMGVVYKAEDIKLKRTVALKFLKPEALGSEEQKARFVTEAQAAAALDHPNICTIHEIDEVEGEIFIVMAYIKGESLKEKIESGPLKLKEGLDIAIQVAQGLQEAHEKGIFHRDIKPANIMLTPKGQAKIMDFGLAKLAEGSVLTKAGTTLGTICFMSPEQARGEEVDHRTDIWSLGVVLYEMLTGQLPFKGEYEQAVFYSILNVDPEPITGLRTGIPLVLEHTVNKCLEKERSDRCQHADELIVDLRRLKRDTSKVISRPPGEPAVPETKAAPAISAGRLRKFVGAIGRLPIYIGAAALIILVLVGYLLWRGKEGPPAPPPVPHLTNPTQLTAVVAVEDYPTWSPEGRTIAYQSNQSGNWDIWVTQVGEGTPVNLTADYTGNDAFPNWSPDGSQIAFLSSRDGGGCFVMPAIGGTPRKIKTGRLINYSSPCWSSDGQELACAVWDSTGFYVEIVSLQSAASRRLMLQQFSGIGYRMFELSWSPDGRYFAYVWSKVIDSPTSQVWVLRAADGEAFPLTDGKSRDWSPGWSQDGSTLYLVSNRGGSMDLWQQRLSEDGTPMGSPQQLTTGLEIRHAVFSPNMKNLIFSKGRQVGNLWRMPILKDHTATWAEAQQLTFDLMRYANPDVSPDGKRLVFDSGLEGMWNIWIMTLESREMQRLITEPMQKDKCTWSPDGREIAFKSMRGDKRDIWAVPVDGGPARQVTRHEAADQEPAWSPDGREIAFASLRSGNNDIWIIPAQGGNARQVTAHTAADRMPEWSPDGEWLLFRSNRTGVNRLWKVPAAGGRPVPVTEGIAWQGVWSLDGKKVYFRASREGEANFWEVPAEGGAERQLTDFTGKYGSLSTAKHATDGQYLYFTWYENLGDIWVMDVVENE